MQRLFTMPVSITAGRFDRSGRLMPTKIIYDGIEHSVQTSTCGLRLTFHHEQSYFWLERRARDWVITRCSR